MKVRPGELISKRQDQTRLDAAQVEKLCEAYRAGSSLRQLAAEFGVHRNTALEHLRRHGVPRRASTRKMTDRDVERAAVRYREVGSLRIVASEFGVGTTTLRREFLKFSKAGFNSTS